MKSTSTALRWLIAARGVAAGIDATYTNNLAGASYAAVLEPNATAPLIGSINTANDLANGTLFNIQFSNLPATGGPFLYHIHVNPVPASGDCYATGGHLDPANNTETPPCNPLDKKLCQAGDLSGMYGSINMTDDQTFNASYINQYVSLTPSDPAYIGNRSFVIHDANLTRIACANFAPPQPLAPPSAASALFSAPASIPTAGIAMNPFAPGASSNSFLPGASVAAGTGISATMTPAAAAVASSQTTGAVLFTGAGAAVQVSAVWAAFGALVAAGAAVVGW